MKKLFLLLTITCLMATGSVWADDLNEQQYMLRADIQKFLNGEGYSNEIDNDGDIAFRKDGKRYYVSVSDVDDNPMYVSLALLYQYDDKYSRDNLLHLMPELNFYKGTKFLLNTYTYSMRAEMYLTSAEPFKNAFYKLMSQIASMEEELETEIYKVIEANSIKISSIYMANADEDDNLISAFGERINSSQTQYLKTRFYATVKNEGTYTFYLKFFNANGDLSTSNSSPDGYTFKYTTTLSSGYKQVDFPGWGGKDAGHWRAGDYKVEIYLNDIKLGEKEFVVR